jgi:hypothetical protein
MVPKGKISGKRQKKNYIFDLQNFSVNIIYKISSIKYLKGLKKYQAVASKLIREGSIFF